MLYFVQTSGYVVLVFENIFDILYLFVEETLLSFSWYLSCISFIVVNKVWGFSLSLSPVSKCISIGISVSIYFCIYYIYTIFLNYLNTIYNKIYNSHIQLLLMSTPTETETETKPTRYNGRVKWFNNGYGFITINEHKDTNKQEDNSNQEDNDNKEDNDNQEEKGQQTKDIFVHHNSIYVETNQYKYLVQGEYVEFDVAPSEKECTKYDFQAKNVTGINGGKLLCETRREYNLEQNKYKQGETSEEGGTSSRAYYSGQGRGYSSIRGRGRGRGRGFGRGV